MDKFTFKSKYGEYKNCWFESGYYENGNLAIDIYSAEEGPISRVTVNPDVKIARTMVAIKDYSENEGMVEWMAKQGLIELNPINIIHSGYVSIPVHKLTEKGLRLFYKGV